MKITVPALAFAVLFTTAAASAQQLRRAAAAADLIAIGKVVRVVPTKNYVLHRVELEEVLRAPSDKRTIEKLTILETKHVSKHSKPIPARTMLLFLHDRRRVALDNDLPEGFAPYYEMSGYPGSVIALEREHAGDPHLALVRVLVASEKGVPSRQTTEALFDIALGGDPRVRTEAASSLSEREVLAGLLTPVHLNRMLARAAAETDDIPYKIALATVCAERKVPEVIPMLCLSVEHVGDTSFLKALGRFAYFIHREGAAGSLLPYVQQAKGQTRERLIVALGATRTDSALETLLRMQREGKDKSAVESALRIHGSPRATAAIRSEKK